jgi:hypothetical protein
VKSKIIVSIEIKKQNANIQENNMKRVNIEEQLIFDQTTNESYNLCDPPQRYEIPH